MGRQKPTTRDERARRVRVWSLVPTGIPVCDAHDDPDTEDDLMLSNDPANATGGDARHPDTPTAPQTSQ